MDEIIEEIATSPYQNPPCSEPSSVFCHTFVTHLSHICHTFVTAVGDCLTCEELGGGGQSHN